MRIIITLLLLFETLVYLFKPAPYLLPPPSLIFKSLFEHWQELIYHASITGVEMLLGFLFGSMFGIMLGAILSFSPKFEKQVTPLLVLTQSLPVFAVAPLLVIWFGFGFTSKIIMAMIIIFLPLTLAFLSGLKSLSTTQNELSLLYKMSHWQRFKYLALPASLPQLFTGLKIAASLAPIAAIVGEWVGSAKGLGFLMLHANARMQTDQLFAALVMLLILAFLFHIVINKISHLVLGKFYS
jgi:putative hydroxymethylpyrimidine transport system permease protein